MADVFAVADPVAFRIGNAEIRWYGIILTSAMIVGLLMLVLMGRKKKISSDDCLEMFLWTVPIAVITARLVYVFANNAGGEYIPGPGGWEGFLHFIAIWEGGITIYGAVLGGFITIVLFCRRKKIPLGAVLDIMVPVMLVCQSLGRWGNFFNQEAFGRPVLNERLHTLPFAVYVDGLHASIAGAEGPGWYQATFLYEGIFNFLGAILMFCLWRKNRVDGALVAPYVVWYCVIRLALDHLRVDGLLSTKVACGILIPCGIAFTIWYYLRGLNKIEHDKVSEEVRLMLDEAD